MPTHWDSEPLGREPDSDLAKKLGVSAAAVKRERERRNIPAHPTKIKIVREIAYTALGRLQPKTLAEIHLTVENEYGSVDRRIVASALATLVAEGVANLLLDESDEDDYNFKPESKRKRKRKIKRYLRGVKELSLYAYVSDQEGIEY